MDRTDAQAMLDRLHRAQNEFYSGGDQRQLTDLLTSDVRWSVPGDNAVAGVYTGVDEVVAYMARRRQLAGSSLRLVRRDVLVGRGNRIAALTDGVAVRRGQVQTWNTVGLYDIAEGRIRACWLLPLDSEEFDAIWT